MKLPSKILPHTVVKTGSDIPDADHPFIVRTVEVGRALTKSHMHQGIELGAILSGTAELYWCGTHVQLEAGDCYFTKAMTPHLTGAIPPGKFQQVYAHISTEAVTSVRPQHLGTHLLAAFSPRASQAAPVIRNRPDIAELLCRAAALAESPDELRWAKAWVSVLEAITMVIEYQQKSHDFKPDVAIPTQPDFLFLAMSHIQHHFREPLTVDQIARHCCISPSHLAHSFARHLGCSPVSYRNTIRIQHAIEEILTSNKSIESIADACGFQSIANFNRLFKKSTDRSPSSLRHDGRIR